jgi:adenylate cyclase
MLRLGVLAVAVFLVVSGLSLSAPWSLLELRGFDHLSTLRTPPLPNDGPVIVAIDEPSLAEVGQQWPWPRALHARLIEALRAAGARVIGLDIVFAEPATSPENDAALEAALGADVVLASDETLIVTPQAEQLVRTLPLPRFLASGARAGIASVRLGPDGVIREVPRYSDIFAGEIAGAAGLERVALPENALLQVFGPGRTYPTVSYYQALDPQKYLPPGFFKDRVVLVGLSLQTAADIHKGAPDTFATSYTTHTGRLTAGVEVQATILDNITRPLSIAPAGRPLMLALVFIAALLGAAVVHRETNWRTVAVCAVGVALSILACYALIRLGRVYVPPFGPALAFLAVVAGQAGFDYASERRSRRHIVLAFSQYLSPQMVARLADDPSQLKLGGESRTLSVLFSDIRGFTMIAERMKGDPQQLTSLINRLLTPLSAEILACGGTIDKYIGDCVMAFWNAPLDDPDHAVHAVRAARQMLGAMERFNAALKAELEARGETPYELRIGIGINTGVCVVGNMGSTSRFDYSALGDSVNLAARLEGESKTLGVPLLIGEETARLAAEQFSVIELDSVIVKGRTEPSPVFTVLEAMPAPEALGLHKTLLTAWLAGTLSASDPLFETLPTAIPELGAYYACLRERVREAGEPMRNWSVDPGGETTAAE